MRAFLAGCALALVLIQPARAGLADDATRYLGRTARDLHLPRSLWCADFMNMLLGRRHASRLARSYARVGRPATPGCIGCIAVLTRRGGAHVGVVAGWQGRDPVVISGNHNGVVGEGVYPHGRLIALREP